MLCPHRFIRVLACCFLLVFLASMQAEQKLGLTIHSYGERTFWYYAGTTSADSSDLALNLDRVKWPAPNWDPSKGPVFHRNSGISAALFGALRIERPGDYRFFGTGNEALLRLGHSRVDLSGQYPVRLAKGPVALQLFLKSELRPRNSLLKFHLLWQGPGMAKPQDIPPAAFSHSEKDARNTESFRPEIPLSNPAIRFFHRRDYVFEIPRDGFYEIVSRAAAPPRVTEMTLDGRFLYHYQYRQHFDPAGPKDFHLDFFDTPRIVRFLKAGKHSLNISGYWGNYPFELTSVKRFFATRQFGLNSLSADNPRDTLSIRVKDREDMVFQKGEALTLSIEQATKEPVRYIMEVVRQRGDGTVVWSKELDLPGGNRHAIGEITFSCREEGAFEYSVKDSSGKMVEGPWAFVVIDPAPLPRPKPSRRLPEMRKELVDSVDCTLEEDPVHKFRDNGTSRVVQGPAGPYRVTGRSYKRRVAYRTKNPLPGLVPVKPGEKGNCFYDAMDWFAYTLRVKHPGRPHVVAAYVPNDVKRLVSVWAYDQVTGDYNAGILEAGEAPESPPFSPISFLVWPNGDAIDLLIFCDSHPHWAEKFWRQGAISRIELYELTDGLPALPAPPGGFSPGKEFGWAGEQVNLGMEQRMMPQLWKGSDKVPGVVDRNFWAEGPYHDWRALRTTWERFGQLARWRGDRLLVWPVVSYSMGRTRRLDFMEQDFESYTRSYRARVVDPRRRDQLKMILLVCQKYGVRFVADFQMSRLYDYVILATDRERKFSADGLYITDARGQVVNYPARILNPAHPLARRYMVNWVEEIARHYGPYPAFGGINIRQWGWHSNVSGYFYNQNWGYDDFTIGLFEKETGVQVPADSNSPDRFGQRRATLLGDVKLRDRWFRWRCDKVFTLRKAMLEALKRHAAQARLYGGAVKEILDFESGSGLDPKQLTGDRDLGYVRTVRPQGPHVENGMLDPVEFAGFDVRAPKSLRRTLDTAMGSRGVEYGRNPCAGRGATIRSHPYQLEPLARALAEGPIDEVLYGGPWISPPLDEGIRQWAQAWQAIPDLKFQRFQDERKDNAALACWFAPQGDDLVFYLVNTTSWGQRAELAFEGKAKKVTDLVTGGAFRHGRRFEVTVPPFMVRLFLAGGTAAIAGLEVRPDSTRVARIERQVRFLESVVPRARGLTHTLYGKGAKYVKITMGQEQYDDGAWGRRDVKMTFGEAAKPIFDAWKAKDYNRADLLLAIFLKEQSWWYEAFGWPEGVYRAEQPGGAYATPRTLIAILESEGPIILQRDQLIRDEALAVPSGQAALKIKARTAGRYALRLWMVSGKRYGPVQVKVDGRPAGQLGTGTGDPYFAHFTLARPLSLLPGLHRLALGGRAKKGLVLHAAELDLAPPQPIRRWSAIGLFDKKSARDGWDGFDTVFPPEREFNPKATYPGMGGKRVKWKIIDIGEDKFIQLLERFFPYDYGKGNGVAYLATWIHSPGNRRATLYYAIDWFGRVWLNNEVVLKQVAGPWRSFAEAEVDLRKGWNKLLVKTSCGRSSWKANFALSDPGDLKYSPLPPE